MAKKDFSGIGTGRVSAGIEKSIGNKGQQAAADPEEQADRAAELRTQGRKGCKAVRINMPFTPENHQFIKIMSRATGKNMTEVTNTIIAAYRNEHPEFLEQAQSFLEAINSGAFSALFKDK